MGNARRFLKPIPAKGKLNLYALDSELAAKAKAAIASAEVVQLGSNENEWIKEMTSLDDEESRRLALFETYVGMNDGKSAVRLAEVGLSKNPDADAILDMARARQVAGNLEAAMSEANRVIEMDPENARAYVVRSEIFHELSDRDRAKAIEINPDYAAILAESKEFGDEEDPA